MRVLCLCLSLTAALRALFDKPFLIELENERQTTAKIRYSSIVDFWQASCALSLSLYPAATTPIIRCLATCASLLNKLPPTPILLSSSKATLLSIRPSNVRFTFALCSIRLTAAAALHRSNRPTTRSSRPQCVLQQSICPIRHCYS